jgi:hypothetical protein
MKPTFHSKTIWFGVLFIVNSFAVAFGFGGFVPGADLSEATSLGIGLIVVLLRFVTDKKIR